MEVISVEQAADYLQCAASKIYRLIHSQELTATKINRYWFICQRSLREFCWQEMLRKGRELLDEQEFSAAQKVFEVLIAHFPEQPEGYYLSARAAELGADLRQALRWYRKCAKDFNSVLAHRALARLYFSQQQYGKALQHYQHLLEQGQRDLNLLYNLGLTFQHLNRPAEARQFLQEAIATDPDYGKAHYALGYLCYREADYAQALQYYERARALDPDSAAVASGLALSYEKRGELSEAAKWYQASLNQGASPELYYNLALIFEDLQQSQQALEAYAKYLQFFPYCTDALYNQALLLIRNQAFQEAGKLLRRTVELAPEHWLAHHNLALIYTQQGQYALAEDAYQKSLKQAPETDLPNIYRNQAYSLYLMGRLENAENVCQKGLALDPGNLDLRQLQASLAYEQNRYAEARDGFASLLEQVADPLPLYHHLGLCQHQLGAYAQAIELYLRVLAVQETPDVHHALGLAYQGQRNHLKAIRHLYRALALEPLHVRSLQSLGQVFSEQRDYTQALKWFRKLTEVEPGNMEAWIQTGFALDNLGQLNDAIGAYRQALQLEQNNLSLYLILGLACSRAGQLEEALQVYQQALTRLPEEAGEVYYLMGLAQLNSGEIRPAIRAFEKSLQHPSRNQREALIHLGGLYLQCDEPVSAIRCYRRLIADDMQNASAYVWLAQAYAARGDKKRFRKYCQMALKIRKDDPEVLYQIAVLYYREEQLREAVSLFQQVVRLQPEHARAHNYLGTIFRSMDCNLEAIRYFQKALKADPEYCVGYMNLSYSYFDLNQSAKAIYYCEQAINCAPDCEEPYYWLGYLHYMQHHWSRAVEAFEQVLEMDPEHAKALKYLPLARHQWIRARNGTNPLKKPAGI